MVIIPEGHDNRCIGVGGWESCMAVVQRKGAVAVSLQAGGLALMVINEVP